MRRWVEHEPSGPVMQQNADATESWCGPAARRARCTQMLVLCALVVAGPAYAAENDDAWFEALIDPETASAREAETEPGAAPPADDASPGDETAQTLPTIAVAPLDEEPPAAAPHREAARPRIEEIVVTARKRAESLQDVPLSVTALSGRDLVDTGHADLTGIADTTPNVEMESISPGITFTYIRGIGTRRFDPGVDQSVATFVDGVYRGRPYSIAADLLDVERVEVLKGPQGTLYGKNTIGGAISITTAPPTDFWAGRLDYEYGVSSVSGDHLDNYSLIASGPLVTDTLGLNLALSRRQRDGYQAVLDDDPPDGQVRTDVAGGSEDAWNGKAKLTWSPLDSTTVRFAGSINRSDGPPPVFAPNDYGNPDARLMLQSPLIPRPEFTGDPRVAVSNEDPLHTRIRIATASTVIEWLGESTSLTSVTGYERSGYSERSDTDGSGLDALGHTVDERAAQITQELRWTIDWDRVQLMLGGFYGEDRIERSEGFDLGRDSIIALLNAGHAAFIDFTTDLDSYSLAVFGQANWDITTRLALTLGLRFSSDEKRLHLRSENDAILPPAVFGLVIEEYDIATQRRWNSVDPLASLSYQIADDVMVYATYSTGYKSGGFQWAAFSESAARRLFDPERVANHEIGAKTTWLDRRLQLNASLFRMDYEDLQVVTFDGGSIVPVSIAQNAAESTVQGAEVEATALIGDDWAVDLSYAYLDAVYDDYLQDPDDPETQRAGNRLARSPEHTWSAALRYSSSLGPGLLSARLGYSWKGEYFWEPDNNSPPRDEIEPALGLWDASVQYRQGPFTISVWGQNLTDETYRALVLDIGPTNLVGQPNVIYDAYAAPRTMGLRIAYEWSE
ncbi:MAG: TonB-dependent receptor [Pseudomonadota bacterium]|nr:TonB-dependent receptor [Pseudomonadota bacterium]